MAKVKQRRVSLLVKNEYPEFYGFNHPWEIPGNELCGKFNPLNKGKKKGEYPEYIIPFTSFEDVDGDIRYYPCSKELMKYDLAEKAKEKERIDILSRCMVPSQRKGLVRCMKKCSECPFKEDNESTFSNGYMRTGGMVYLDHLSIDEEVNSDLIDGVLADYTEEQYNNVQEAIEKELLIEQIRNLIEKRDEIDKQIYALFDLSNAEISRKINVPRKTISDHRIRMINDLRKYFKV